MTERSQAQIDRGNTMPPEMFDRLGQLPNVRDYQAVDLYLKDGRVLEDVVFIDGALADPRVAEYLPDVVDVQAGRKWLQSLQPQAPEPLKWR